MNELLQKHGCSSVFSIPEGLKELMSDISREVLREQPPKLYEFIANYLSCLLITRQHGILAVKVLDDLCDCQPTVSEHLMQIGLEKKQVADMSKVIKKEIETGEIEAGTAKLREAEIIKKILDMQSMMSLDEDTVGKVCQVIRKAYRDYCYRKKLLQKTFKVDPQEPWEIAAQRTLEVYKSTKPSPHELHVATEKIQAAYKGYYVRKNLLHHLHPRARAKKASQPGPEMAMPGPPIDVSASREMELGSPVNIQVKSDVNEERAAAEYEQAYKKAETEDGDKPSRSCQDHNQGRRHTRLASDLPNVITYKKYSIEEDFDKQELTKMISFSEASPEVIDGVVTKTPPEDSGDNTDTKAVHQFIRSFGSSKDEAFSSALDVLDIAPASDDGDDDDDDDDDDDNDDNENEN